MVKILKYVALVVGILAIVPIAAILAFALWIQFRCQGQVGGCTDIGLIFFPLAPYLAIAWIPVAVALCLIVAVLILGHLRRWWLGLAILGLIIGLGIEAYFIHGNLQVAHDKNISQGEAVKLITSCQVGYVYPAHFSKSSDYDDPNIQLWILDKSGVTVGLKKTPEANWAAVTQAVNEAKGTCHIYAGPGIDPYDQQTLRP